MVVMPQPRVSVITPTFNRHELLLDRCIPSVRGQTYTGDIEHIVVSDTPDPDLASYMAEQFFQDYDHRPLVYDEMRQHNPDIHFGGRARLHGLNLALGDIIFYLDDDNAWRPEHVGLLVAALGISGADFAYSVMLRHPLGDHVGMEPPRYAQVDTSVLAHRAGISPVGWNPGQRADPDWEAVSAWLEAGRTWVHVPHVTCDYYMRGYSV